MSFGWFKSKEPGLSRRAFLGTTGTVVGLPLLTSLLPREARAAATTAPKRLLYYYVPDGMVMAAWKPTSAGASYTLSPILQPLAALKADFMVVSGTVNQPAKPATAGDHAAGTSGFITCATALKSASESKLGISIDQVAANAVGKNTRVPFVALGTEGGALAGTCDSGYGCPYVRAISWSGVSTPISKITDPKVAFDLIFQGFDPTATAGDQARRTARRKSVLDAAVAQAMSLQKRLGTSDRRKLDEYLTSVRETEREIIDTPTGGGCAGATPPAAGATKDLESLVHAMSDLMVLAMQCDVSRIFTFMMGNAGGQHVYSNLGITRGHHDISHHGGNATNLMQLQTIDTYEVTLLNYLLTKMKATQDGDADLLFNSTIYYSSEISDGDRHNHDDMPVLIAGHGGGMYNQGQHYSLPTTTKVSDMLVGTLRTIGINDAKLGDSTGPVMDVFKA